MAKNEFLENFAACAAWLSPTIIAEGTDLTTRPDSQMLRRAALWLNPAAVEGFDPDDFPALSQQERHQLVKDVASFRDIAQMRPNKGPASPDQVRGALPPFLSILKILGPSFKEKSEKFDILNELKYKFIPSLLKSIDIQLGSDSTGEPAVWVWGILKDELGGREHQDERFELKDRIRSELQRIAPSRLPYVGFRTWSEQLQLEAAPPR